MLVFPSSCEQMAVFFVKRNKKWNIFYTHEMNGEISYFGRKYSISKLEELILTNMNKLFRPWRQFKFEQITDTEYKKNQIWYVNLQVSVRW